VDEPVVMYAGAGTAAKQYYHTDAQGSVIAMSDASGQAIETHTYDPYGVSADTGSGNDVFRCSRCGWLRQSSHGTGLKAARYTESEIGL